MRCVKDEEQICIEAAATIALAEVGFGSGIHAFHIPLGGHLLSLNQIFFLTRAQAKGESPNLFRAFHISTLVAMLKTLSPAGKKLTPMLAIATQGLFYSLGTFIPGIMGIFLAAILSGLWAFIQPVLIYLIIFGKNFFEIVSFYIEKIDEVILVNESTWWKILILMVTLKSVLSVLVASLAWVFPQIALSYEKKLLLISRNIQLKSNGNLVGGAFKQRDILRDIFNPMFACSLILTGMFFYFSEASLAQWIWGLLRPLMLSYLLYFAIRWIPQSPWALRFQSLTAFNSLRETFQRMKRGPDQVETTTKQG